MKPISRTCEGWGCGNRLTVRQAKFCSKRCAWGSRHELAQCGTAAALRRHYRRGEVVDWECKLLERRMRMDRGSAA